MFNSKKLQEKWAPIMKADEVPAIADGYKAGVTAVLLENTERALAEERGQAQFLNEAAPANHTGANISNWDPILISLVRRATPNLIAFDLAGVQPMSGPTGLIFAIKSRYTAQDGTEALFDEVNTAFSGTGTQGGGDSSLPGDVVGAEVSADTTPADTVEDNFGFGTGMSTAAAEALGTSGGGTFNEMAFSIEKATVTAKSRALKAEYTMELAQDLNVIHGLDAENVLASFLSSEILAEMNREVLRTINSRAKLGCQQSDLTAAGDFDLDTDADGRWSVEKYKGLLVQIQREANTIAVQTRRGKGNFLVVSSDVAAALSASAILDYTPALNAQANMQSDPTGPTYVGNLVGGTKVFLDPYATVNYVTVGYKGTSAYDAGMFYCPYVPLTMVRAIAEDSFQPRIGFKTRYGMVANPFVATDGTIGAVRSNPYFRIFKVSNILGSA